VKGFPKTGGWGWALLVALGAFSLAGCASATFDRHFESGRYLDAVRTYRANPSLDRDSGVLLRLAVLHMAEESPTYDPDRAEALLHRVLDLSPQGPAALQARFLLRHMEAVRVADAVLMRTDREVAALEARITALEEEREALREEVVNRDEELDRITAESGRLQAVLQERQAEIRQLQATMEELKRIDMRRSPLVAIPQDHPPPARPRD